MIKEIDDPANEAVLDVRRTVTIAEAVLTVWLGALLVPNGKFRSAYRWDMDFL